jgi:hypothetical protein
MNHPLPETVGRPKLYRTRACRSEITPAPWTTRRLVEPHTRHQWRLMYDQAPTVGYTAVGLLSLVCLFHTDLVTGIAGPLEVNST